MVKEKKEPAAAAAAEDGEKLIGRVVHFYGNIDVAIVELAAPLSVGQTIHIKGANDDFIQEVSEMQFEHEAIEQGKKGQQVGVKVSGKVHENDLVFLAE